MAARVARSLWFRPAVAAVAAVAVLAAAPFVAHLLPSGLMTLIGLSGVYDLLDALANTLLAVAIFSLGIMASSLRAASAAATPRVRPLLAQDPTARAAISTFIGGFVFSVVGIVGLSTGYYGNASKVLLFFVTCLLLLVLMVSLLRWIARLSRLGDVAESIDLVEEEARRTLRELAADPFLGGTPAEGPPAGGEPVLPEAPGYVQAVDANGLGTLADELGADLHLVARPGRFVGPGRPLAVAMRALSDEERARVRGAFLVGRQRTFEADPRFALTVLSEIGSKALSPGINDPGTAIDVIATAVHLLCDWSEATGRASPEVRHPRLRVEPIEPGALLRDALRWIARDGAALAEVQHWLQTALLMLATQDPARFAAPARALSAEALARADAAMTLPQDLEPLRALAARVQAA
nr:DUF2254 family protein [Rubellimicrobium aerolatum]